MIVFFFFKQKTAYEMRISDWSSDVCSSDLEHLVEADLFGPEHRPAPIDREAIAEKVDDVDVAGPDGDAFLEDFRPLVDQRIHAALDDLLIGNRPEIGRAACRERVCQYV